MRLAQFNLANVPASGINFFGDQRRPFGASAWRSVAATIDANGRRRGIEVRLEHCIVSNQSNELLPQRTGQRARGETSSSLVVSCEHARPERNGLHVVSLSNQPSGRINPHDSPHYDYNQECECD
jgi:hypothetical protein